MPDLQVIWYGPVFREIARIHEDSRREALHRAAMERSRYVAGDVGLGKAGRTDLACGCAPISGDFEIATAGLRARKPGVALQCGARARENATFLRVDMCLRGARSAQ